MTLALSEMRQGIAVAPTLIPSGKLGSMTKNGNQWSSGKHFSNRFNNMAQCYTRSYVSVEWFHKATAGPEKQPVVIWCLASSSDAKGNIPKIVQNWKYATPRRIAKDVGNFGILVDKVYRSHIGGALVKAPSQKLVTPREPLLPTQPPEYDGPTNSLGFIPGLQDVLEEAETLSWTSQYNPDTIAEASMAAISNRSIDP